MTVSNRRDKLIEFSHPAVSHLLKMFKFDHLPDHLRGMSMDFCELACKVAEQGRGIETAVALRKLLESKDAAVRSLL